MSKKKNNYTPLSSIGEFGLISRIKSNFDLKNSSSLVGIGEDAAVIDNKNKTVVSTDMLVENIHFNLMYVPLKHLGYKSVVVNLSDIFAMNAKPEQITVSLSVSNRFTLEAVDELYSGIKLACEKYKVDLVGGETIAMIPAKLSESKEGYQKGDDHKGRVVPRVIRMDVGDSVIYDRSLLHGVSEIEKGKRLVLVSWFTR